MKVFNLCILISVFIDLNVHAQNKNQYTHKADDFIKDFIAQINLILDPILTYDERVQTKNIVLDDMINSRENTILYDNISDQEVKNSNLSAQTYLDRLFTRFTNQMPLKNLNENYIKFQFGNFQSDTFYIADNGVDKICLISRIINLDSIPSDIKYRSDTISFVVAFKKGDLDDRRILSSFKYVHETKPSTNKEIALYEPEKMQEKELSIKSDPTKNKPVEKKVKNEHKVNSAIELPISFNLKELKAMDSNSFDLSYSNIKFPLIPELSNLETIIFQINFYSANRLNVNLKQFIFVDNVIVNLHNINSELLFENGESSEVITKFNIKLQDQVSLQTFLQSNK